MVIIVMHRTHDRLWLTLWTAEEANGGAWNIAVACSCMAGRQGLAKPITWLESILITLGLSIMPRMAAKVKIMF